MLRSSSSPTLKRTMTIARPGLDVEYRYSTPGISQRSRSSGLVTRASTSLARRAGHPHEDVAHRNDDLRLFLARELPDGEGAEEHRRDEQQWRELRMNEGARELARRCRASQARSSAHLDGGAVAQIGGGRGDDGFGRGEPREDLRPRPLRVAAGDHSKSRVRSIDDEDAIEGPERRERRRRNDQARSSRRPGSSPGRRSRAGATPASRADRFHEERTGRHVHARHDSRRPSRRAARERLESRRSLRPLPSRRRRATPPPRLRRAASPRRRSRAAEFPATRASPGPPAALALGPRGATIPAYPSVACASPSDAFASSILDDTERRRDCAIRSCATAPPACLRLVELLLGDRVVLEEGRRRFYVPRPP